MDLLSIIIPVYNSEKYLKKCLDSIILQTYKNFEIICVDDGSIDSSYQILKEYQNKDSRIRLLKQEHKGVSSARKLGLTNACGKYITFVDSDDYLDKETYLNALKYLNIADLVCFGIRVFGEFQKSQINDDNKYYKIKNKGLTNIFPKLPFRIDVSLCNKIFKRELIDKFNIDFTDNCLYEDAEFCFKYLLCSKKIYFLNKYFYNYRRRRCSIMTSVFDNGDSSVSHLYILDNIFKFMVENSLLHKNELFENIIFYCFDFAQRFSKNVSIEEILNLVEKYFVRFSEKISFVGSFSNKILNKRYEEIYEPEFKFYQKLLKIKKIYNVLSNNYYYNLYFLGKIYKLNWLKRAK